MVKQKRSGVEMRRMMAEFEGSGMRRGEFCQRHSIPLTTFDYYRQTRKSKPRLVKVEVSAPEPSPGFTLRLANGRQIESSWRFGEGELARLIRIAESA